MFRINRVKSLDPTNSIENFFQHQSYETMGIARVQPSTNPCQMEQPRPHDTMYDAWVMTLDRIRPARVMRGRVMITDHCRRQVRLIRRSSYYNDVCMTWIQCSARTHSVLQRHESLSASYVEALCPSTNRHETYKGY